MRNKRAVFLISFLILFTIPTALATFNIGEPPEKDDLVVRQQADYSSITGNAVADNHEEKAGWDYILFLIALFIVVLGAVIFLFQRVKPK